MKEKFKSPVLWITLFALLALILKDFYNLEIPDYDKIVELIMALLIGFGVVNNPDNRDGF